MVSACPRCGAALPEGGRPRCLPLGRVLSLIGGLALVAAYFMPWFGVQLGGQGIVLSGEFLGRFLSSTTDLRRFVPGLTDPSEGQRLRLLVALFPTAGGLAALLALVGSATRRFRGPLDALLAACGLVPLLALLIGISRFPPGSTLQVGLYLIGAGALAVLAGAGVGRWGMGDGEGVGC